MMDYSLIYSKIFRDIENSDDKISVIKKHNRFLKNTNIAARNCLNKVDYTSAHFKANRESLECSREAFMNAVDIGNEITDIFNEVENGKELTKEEMNGLKIKISALRENCNRGKKEFQQLKENMQ